MKVKMIIERIMKVLLKSKIIYSCELIYSHGKVWCMESPVLVWFYWGDPKAFS